MWWMPYHCFSVEDRLSELLVPCDRYVTKATLARGLRVNPPWWQEPEVADGVVSAGMCVEVG